MATLRRFYFDDGSSRKRWQVACRGKTQTVGYGRLGSDLRVIEKSFNSPADARESTASLIASKLKAGYIEINPTALAIKRPPRQRVATSAQIRKFEQSIGAELPTEYRSFLRSQNGGWPNPPFVETPGIPYIANVHVGFIYGLYSSVRPGESLSWGIRVHSAVLPPGHLPIALGSDLFTLSLKKKFGCVYFWNHESDQIDDDERFLESAGYVLAGSFEEFLTRIAIFYGQEDVETTSSDENSSKKLRSKPSIKQLFRLMKYEHTPEKIKEIEEVVRELGDLSGIKDGEWPFVNINSVRLLRCLLKAGLNPEITDTNNQSLLWQCARSSGCIDLLLKQGVDLERRNGEDRETALMRAIFLDSISGVERLLQAGANPTVRLAPYISSKLRFNEKLGKVVENARTKWRRKAANKKGEKRM